MIRAKALRSPLFYVGDKYKLIQEISTHFPDKISKFIEPFAGGGSVFLNINADEYLLNDINVNVYYLHKFLMEQAKVPEFFFNEIEKIIEKYNLSRSYKENIVPDELKRQWKKTYYAQFNKSGFEKLKNDFNKAEIKNYFQFYLLLIYGFNRMIRFNTSGKYNLPVGNVDFNRNVVEALTDYFTVVNRKNLNWSNEDYIHFIRKTKPAKNDFVYLDPPYLITFSEYNKLWNENKEEQLLNLLEELNKKGIRFAISNVTHYKNKENTIFSEWAKKYKMYPIKSNYISYYDNSIKNFKEVLITNY